MAGADMVATEPGQFAVLAAGGVSADGNVSIGGNLGAGKELWLGNQSQVLGATCVQGALSTGNGVTMAGDVLAGGSVYLGNNTSAGNLYGFGSISTGNNVDLASVTGNGYVGLGNKNEVAGNLVYGSSYWAPKNSSIGGSVEKASMAANSWQPTWRPSPALMSSVSDSEYYKRGSEVYLEPGDYGKLSIDANATIHLSGGEYNISSLWLGSGVKILSDSQDKDVVLNLVGNLSIDSNVVLETAGIGQTLFAVGGTTSLGSNGDFDASFFGFGDSVDIGQGNQVDGMVYSAGSVWMGSGVTVSGAGLNGGAVPEPQTAILLGLGCLLLRPRRRNYC